MVEGRRVIRCDRAGSVGRRRGGRAGWCRRGCARCGWSRPARCGAARHPIVEAIRSAFTELRIAGARRRSAELVGFLNHSERPSYEVDGVPVMRADRRTRLDATNQRIQEVRLTTRPRSRASHLHDRTFELSVKPCCRCMAIVVGTVRPFSFRYVDASRVAVRSDRRPGVW